jgi:hypothetical protein
MMVIQRNVFLCCITTLEATTHSSHSGPFIPRKGGPEARWALQRNGHNGGPKYNRGNPHRRVTSQTQLSQFTVPKKQENT